MDAFMRVEKSQNMKSRPLRVKNSGRRAVVSYTFSTPVTVGGAASYRIGSTYCYSLSNSWSWSSEKSADLHLIWQSFCQHAHQLPNKFFSPFMFCWTSLPCASPSSILWVWCVYGEDFRMILSSLALSALKCQKLLGTFLIIFPFWFSLLPLLIIFHVDKYIGARVFDTGPARPYLPVPGLLFRSLRLSCRSKSKWRMFLKNKVLIDLDAPCPPFRLSAINGRKVAPIICWNEGAGYRCLPVTFVSHYTRGKNGTDCFCLGCS